MHIRDLNRDELTVINSIFSLYEPTRSALVRDTHFSLAKLSSIIGKLERNNFVFKKGKTKSVGGRPSYIYEVNPRLGHSIGISIKLDSMNFVGVNCSKEIVGSWSFPLDPPSFADDGISAFVDQLSQGLEEVVIQEFEGKEQLISIGLALTGMVDTNRGVWLQGLQIPAMAHVNLREKLEKRFSLSAFLEDTARAVAYREKLLGYGGGIPAFVLLYIGMGMGAGIVIDNKIYRGIHGLAGEIGHILHPDISYRCSCNTVGCLETVLSTPGILRLFKDRLKQGVLSELQQYDRGESEALSLDAILGAASRDDRFALTTLTEVSQFLAETCAILIKAYNPKKIVISGEVSILKDFLQSPLHQIIQQRVMAELLQDLEIVFADYAPIHEAHGVGLLALNHYFANSLNDKRK